MNPDELKNKMAQLQHANPLPATDPKNVLVPDEQTYKKKMREIYFEKVYPYIEKWTFKSSFIPLSSAQLEALIDRHNEFARTGEKYNWLTTQELIKLEAQIDVLHKGLGVDLIFVRLSSRSPKDAGTNSKRFENLFTKELRHLEDFEFNSEALGDPSLAPTTSENRKLHALCSALNLALGCPNGKEAIELLVESERIQGDLSEAVADKVPLTLIIREYKPFNVELEFRGFVVNKKLTALTQYNEYCYFPNLVYKRNYIQELIKDFFKDNLADAIPLESYLIDFVCHADSKTPPYNMKVGVVELNPFGEFASAGLFKWELAHDNEVLRGLKPFEFRIASEPIKDVIKKIPADWKDLYSIETSATHAPHVVVSHPSTPVTPHVAHHATTPAAAPPAPLSDSSSSSSSHGHHHHHRHHEEKKPEAKP